MVDFILEPGLTTLHALNALFILALLVLTTIITTPRGAFVNAFIYIIAAAAWAANTYIGTDSLFMLVWVTFFCVERLDLKARCVLLLAPLVLQIASFYGA